MWLVYHLYSRFFFSYIKLPFYISDSLVTTFVNIYPHSFNDYTLSKNIRGLHVFYTSSIDNVRDHLVHVSVSTGAGLWCRGKTVGTDIDSDAI